MKPSWLWACLFVAGLALGFALGLLFSGPYFGRSPVATAPARVASGEVLVTLSAQIDGSDRFRFTRENISHEHFRWSPPRNAVFNGEPWPDLTVPPPAWAELAKELDLTRAAIAVRKSRDMIALETTPEGFDLYFADTLMGAATFEVTIAIPRK